MESWPKTVNPSLAPATHLSGTQYPDENARPTGVASDGSNPSDYTPRRRRLANDESSCSSLRIVLSSDLCYNDVRS